MLTASQIINRFGGPSPLAKASGFPLTTIIGWREANFIPEWRRPALMALAADRDKPFKLVDADFPPIEARVPRKAKAA